MNAETFNALYEVGIPVFAYPGARPEDIPNRTRLVTRTRSKASVLSGHTDVVWVDGHSACIALSHVDVVSEDEFKTAREADLAAAVAAEGALPMPAGPEPKRLDLDAFAAEVRSAALTEAVDMFDRMAANEPDQSYRARVMRGAANDVRRLITNPTAPKETT